MATLSISESTKLAFCVIGLGYVGTSLSILLSSAHKVNVLDIDTKKIENFNDGKIPIADLEAERALLNHKENIFGFTDPRLALAGVKTVIISTPTNFDEHSGQFDTSTVEDSIKNAIQFADAPNIAIKSTVPIGFTDRMRHQFDYQNIFFSPEFLREGSAYADNLNPSRIIVGDTGIVGKEFGETLLALTVNDPPLLAMSSKEAEAVKLMSNAYLAMRVGYFNEVDSFALSESLDARNIIEGICLDTRIGVGFNNPSFGYGGYCFPKDTKQLRSDYETVPQSLVSAIVETNATRIEYICREIKRRARGGRIGVHRLIMKAGSENFRASSSMAILEGLNDIGARLMLFEPLVTVPPLIGVELIHDIETFKAMSDLIIANRMSADLEDVANKTFSRDIFNEN